MMLGVGLGYAARAPPSCGPLAGDGSGVSPSTTGAGRRFSAGLAGGTAEAGAQLGKGEHHMLSRPSAVARSLLQEQRRRFSAT